MAPSISDGTGAIAYAIGASLHGFVPLFIGRYASRVATCLAEMINPGFNFVRTLDPTVISLSDVFRDVVAMDPTDFQTLIRGARERQDLLFPVVLCNVNCSPARFWLDALVTERDRSSMPKNVVVFLSASAEPNLEPFPRSSVDYLVPIVTTKLKPGYVEPKIGSAWPIEPRQYEADRVVEYFADLPHCEPHENDALKVIRTASTFAELPKEQLTAVFSTHLRWMRREPISSDCFPEIVKDS